MATTIEQQVALDKALVPSTQRNTKAYKEYYAFATREVAPKPKANKHGDERDDIDQDQEVAKHDDKDDTEESRDVDEEGESDEEDDKEETKDEESFNHIPQTPKSSEDKGDGEEDQSLRISEEERLNEEEEAKELYRNQESSSVSSHFVTSMVNPPSDAGMESIFVTASSSVAPLQTSTPIMTPSTIATITTISHAAIPPTTILSEVLQNLPTFDSVFRFEDRLKSLEASFSEYRQTNSFDEAVSNILGIVHHYMNQQMTEAV
nr:hypothetical protein [Tanacetum cinerariifolium]